MAMKPKIAASDLKRWQYDGEELALIDVRQQVDFGEQHLLCATCIPLSRMEVMARDLLPCPCTRIVLVDDGFSSQPPLAEKAAEVLKAIGYPLSKTALWDGSWPA